GVPVRSSSAAASQKFFIASADHHPSPRIARAASPGELPPAWLEVPSADTFAHTAEVPSGRHGSPSKLRSRGEAVALRPPSSREGSRNSPRSREVRSRSVGECLEYSEFYR